MLAICNTGVNHYCSSWADTFSLMRKETYWRSRKELSDLTASTASIEQMLPRFRKVLSSLIASHGSCWYIMIACHTNSNMSSNINWLLLPLPVICRVTWLRSVWMPNCRGWACLIQLSPFLCLMKSIKNLEHVWIFIMYLTFHNESLLVYYSNSVV